MYICTSPNLIFHWMFDVVKFLTIRKRFSVSCVTCQVQLNIVIFTLNGFSCIFERFKKKIIFI